MKKFDSVHNEYLQYLVTIGIVGMIAYISLLVTVLARLIRKGKENPVVLSIAMAVICYGAQALVNIKCTYCSTGPVYIDGNGTGCLPG